MTDKIVDYSYLNTYSECKRRWWYRYHEMLALKGGDSVPLLAGSVGHKVMASLYGSGWDLEHALQVLAQEYVLSGLVPIGTYDYMTEGHLETIIRNYYKEYHERDPFKVVEVIEEPIVADIKGLDFPVGGIPDMLVEDEDGFWIVDHKFTTGYLGDRFYDRFKYSKQLPIYVLLARAKYADKLIKGAIINAIYMGKGASVAISKAQRFDRYRFDYSESLLDETKRWLKGNWLATNITNWEPIQNPGMHCSWCSYNELCSSGVEVRELKIDMLYEKREPGGLLASGADSD